jgi:undecaprenyl-diphosphatase
MDERRHPRRGLRRGVLVGGGGVLAGLAVTRLWRTIWPAAPRTASRTGAATRPLAGEPNPDGEGLTIIVNPDAGPAHRASPTDLLRDGLPAARIVELSDGLTLDEALDQASDARALGMAGGDGSVNTTAAVAHATGRPLVVVPSGTLNHFARDVGLTGPEDAVTAVREGHLVAVDLGSIDGKAFLNTASFGSYSELVDTRERLEGKLGRWPAMFVALVSVLWRTKPLRVELDGRERSLWMIFIGNCRYHPSGFAPAWRERMDDGLLDIRLVGSEQRWARTRILLAMATGRLGRSHVYEELTTERLHVRSLDGPLRLARDGETFDGGTDVVVCKEREPVAVYVPRADG